MWSLEYLHKLYIFTILYIVILKCLNLLIALKTTLVLRILFFTNLDEMVHLSYYVVVQ